MEFVAQLARATAMLDPYLPAGLSESQKLLVVFVFEHLVLSLRLVMPFLVPPVPGKVKRRLQRLKARSPVGQRDHGLAVDERAIGGKLGHLGDEPGEAVKVTALAEVVALHFEDQREPLARRKFRRGLGMCDRFRLRIGLVVVLGEGPGAFRDDDGE